MSNEFGKISLAKLKFELFDKNGGLSGKTVSLRATLLNNRYVILPPESYTCEPAPLVKKT